LTRFRSWTSCSRRSCSCRKIEMDNKRFQTILNNSKRSETIRCISIFKRK
jgi:hypothetical protein